MEICSSVQSELSLFDGNSIFPKKTAKLQAIFHTGNALVKIHNLLRSLMKEVNLVMATM